MDLLKKLETPLIILLRLLLGNIFLWSGLEKAWNPDLFYQAAQNYHILSPILTRFYAVSLPWVEILVGCYFLFGLFLRFTSILTCALLTSFIIAASLVLLRGEHIDCGCFISGIQATPVSISLILRDTFLLIGSIYLFFSKPIRLSLDAWLN